MVSLLPSVIHEGLCRRCPSLVQPEFSLSAKPFLARALGWKSPVASMTQDKTLLVGHPWSLPCGVALGLNVSLSCHWEFGSFEEITLCHQRAASEWAS